MKTQHILHPNLKRQSKQKYLIDIIEFCKLQYLEVSFIHLLQKAGLIEIITLNNNEFINASQLPQLDKIVGLHFAMETS